MKRTIIPIVLQLNDATEFLTPENIPDAPPVVVDNDGTPLKRTLLLMVYYIY
jgi:hypothetical protein